MFGTLIQLIDRIQNGLYPVTRKTALFGLIFLAVFTLMPTKGTAVSTIPLTCSDNGISLKDESSLYLDARSVQTNSPLISRPKTKEVMVTAYTSEVAQTDDTPFITASNTTVRDGIVAANFLPFGTRIKISGFGDKVFTVEDRMHRRFQNYVDIWMESKEEALDFGVKKMEITILN